MIMSGLTITALPREIMHKRAFTRAMPSPAAIAQPRTGVEGAEDITLTRGRPQCRLLGQEDYLREYDPSAHAIRSLVYYPNIITSKKGEALQAKIRSRIAIGFQRRIHSKRLTALIGNNVSHRLISGSGRGGEDMLARLREGWEEHLIETDIFEAVRDDGIVGDCAIVHFLDGGQYGTRVFSFRRGDILFPHVNPLTGAMALFGRLYSVDEEGGKPVRYLDVWDKQYYMRWREDGSDEAGGWVVDVEPAAHGFTDCPVDYHRYGRPFWDNSQELIEAYELAISQFAENNAAYALRILYAFGSEMSVCASVDGTPMRIDSPDSDSKVGFLEPAEGADGAFAKQLDILEKNIMRSSFAVETPEIKSGADLSSLTVKMMFADTYLKALEDGQEYQRWLGGVTRHFLYGYGLERGALSEFSALRVRTEFEPYIFMSETETVNCLVQLVGSGIISRESASQMAYDSGYGTAAEWERVLNEAHAELVGAGKVAATEQDINLVANARGERG